MGLKVKVGVIVDGALVGDVGNTEGIRDGNLDGTIVGPAVGFEL